MGKIMRTVSNRSLYDRLKGLRMAKFDYEAWKRANEHLLRDAEMTGDYSKVDRHFDKFEAACQHKHTTTENFPNGAQIVWCDIDRGGCGARVSAKGSGAFLRTQPKVRKKKSWCSLVLLLMIGSLSALGWGVVEASRAVFG